MALRKYATLEVLEAWRHESAGVPAAFRARRIIRHAHRVAFDYQPRDGYLYVRSRMISSRTNDNHDTFPAEEIEAGYKSFLGKPVFVNHHNANHRRARGVIVALALHRDRNPDGSPDTWVEGLMEVDAVKFPRLAKAILTGRVNRTSMGVDVDWSTCSACGNKATSPAEYCKHLPAMKGKKIRQRNKATGKVEEKLIHEICAGLSFFENSLLVEDPADPTAYLLGKPDARGLGKAASRKTASGPDLRSFDQLQPHEQQSVAQYHPQMVEEGNAPPGSTLHDYLYESRQEPRDEFLGRYMDADEEFRREYGPGDWEAHHAETLAAHPVPRYPAENRWPLIVSDSNPNYVDDGYHRMHSYMRDGATHVPTVRMHPRIAANGSGPDFRDHFGNTCLDCGLPVRYQQGPRAGFRHDTPRDIGHPARPADPGDQSRSMNPGTFGGTHCLTCGDDVKINLRALDRNGGWHHGDGMKRDHDALPADPQAVYDSIPGVRAQFDQARSQMRDQMHSQFEQLSGRPLPRKPRGDEDQMPLDPFTGAEKRKGGDHPWFREHPLSKDHIVAAWDDATDDEKELGRRWYSDAHHIAKAIAHGDAALGAGLLSAYSPQTAWPVNMFNASRATKGDPPGPGTGAMGVQQKAAMRILGGEHHSKVLTAPKTSAFAHLIEHGGNTDEDRKSGKTRVVIDRHALSVAAGRRLSKEESGKAPMGQRQHYEHAEQLFRDAAHDISKASGKDVTEEEVQAATWLRQVRKNTEEDSSGSRGGGGKGRVKMQDNSRTRWTEHHRHHHPGGIPEENMHHHGQHKTAYGETRVPPQVDTLRMDECPVCGENSVWSGSRCPVCGFVVPPSVFRDPDTDKAKQVRDQLDGAGEVDLPPDAPAAQGPDGEIPGQEQIGSGDDADEQLVHPDQIAPDGVPVVQGEGGQAAGTDGQPPDPGAAENEEEEAGEQEAQAEGIAPPGPPGEPGDPGLNTGEDLECPACGTTFETDGAAQPGVPCPACGMASLHPIDEDPENEVPGGPQKEQEDPSGPGDDEGAEGEEEEDEDMPESKTAAALAQAQARRIAELSARNAVLEAKLSFLASVAGVGQEFSAIETEIMRRHADMLNPASPVPDPPQAPAPESTEQALMPASQDNASRPGTSPGANAHVPAAQTTTAITPGVEMQTPPATQLIDVTAPIQGTNPSQDGGVPIEQRRIETDVRIDPDPLKAHGPGIGGQGDNGAAFPWLLNAGSPAQQGGQPGQQRAASRSEEESTRRTFASIRLAKMRITAGVVQGDELAVATHIERDAGLSTAMIEHEISVLGSVPQRRAEPQRPVQRTAARQAPSLASVGASSMYAPAVDYGDDGSDIFL